MIQTEKLVYEYEKRDEEGNIIGSHRAINAVDVHVEPGEFVAILGHNGSGKSTLAKHMNAILTPTEGTMWVNGRDTKEPDNLWEVRQSAGMVFQNPDNQLVATVVEEDIAFGPENMGVEPKEIRKRVDEALATVRMSEYATHTPSKLSGGQKQRIAIAGVLAMKPQCIVLDEPTAMLDPVGRRDVMETIERLNREEGITMILITHYMDEAVRADKVFVIDDGDLVMQGTPKEIFSQVDMLKKYRLDVPQVTLLAHELKKSGVDIPDGILTTEELVNCLCQ